MAQIRLVQDMEERQFKEIYPNVLEIDRLFVDQKRGIIFFCRNMKNDLENSLEEGFRKLDSKVEEEAREVEEEKKEQLQRREFGLLDGVLKELEGGYNPTFDSNGLRRS